MIPPRGRPPLRTQDDTTEPAVPLPPDVHGPWLFRRDRNIYHVRLLQWLSTREIREQIGPADGARALRVQSLMLEADFVRRSLGPARAAHAELAAKALALRAALDRAERRADGVMLEWRWMSLIASVGLLLRFVVFQASWYEAAGAALLVFLTASAVRRSPASVASLRCLWRMTTGAVVAAWAWTQYAQARPRWQRAMAHAPVPDALRQIARAAFLMEAGISVRTRDTAGLRAAADRSYLVSTRAARELRRKTGLMDAGTIALCGPRGVGKTTLLESALERATLSVRTHTPARYAPHDFLLALFIDVCERYIALRGFPVPAFRRLGRFDRPMRWIRRGPALLLFATPPAVFLVFGLKAGVQGLGELYGPAVARRAGAVEEAGRRGVDGVWHGHSAGAALVAAALGVAWWRFGRAGWARRAAGSVWRGGCTVLGALLVVVPLGTLLTDPDVFSRLGVMQSGNEGLGNVIRLLIAVSVLNFVIAMSGHTAAFRGAHLTWWWEKASMPCLYAATAWALLRDGDCRAVITDDGNPGRLAVFLTGLVLLRLSDWRTRGLTPRLVTRCRDHLLHLRTVQSRAASWSTAVPAAGLGVQVGTSLSTVPPNFPELVDDFRDLLGRIAREIHEQKGTVVVAVDELDRLGDGATVLAFLNEIKAVFGVPYVHYLVSVADDVGAAFVRRGLPHRDATDSTLDDVITVQPCLLSESRALLTRRMPGLTETHVLLVHALAGGLPRDLIRYGRRLVDLHLNSSEDLPHHARTLVLEELAEAVTGFRLLLSRQPWPQGGAVLSAFRDLTVQLRRTADQASSDLDQALRTFAFEGRVTSPEEYRAVPDTAQQLMLEASVFGYFCLTLLDVFAVPGFAASSSDAQAHGPDGDPALLAEAHTELGVSPDSARLLITRIRRAWGLPVVTPPSHPPAPPAAARPPAPSPSPRPGSPGPAVTPPGSATPGRCRRPRP